MYVGCKPFCSVDKADPPLGDVLGMASVAYSGRDLATIATMWWRIKSMGRSSLGLVRLVRLVLQQQPLFT